jgi:beta-glucanase (GH16 family)
MEANQPIRLAGTARRRIRFLAVSASSLLLVGASVSVAFNAEAVAPPTPAGWTANFLDDFNGNALNGGNWRVIQGTSYPGGPANFGTGEVEVSTPAAVSVTNGAMSITARGQGTGGWTAARVETNRADFQPPAGGKLRVEARLKLPEAPNGQSAGYWPAFWMLGGTYRGNWWNWPTVGEFDIMESVNGANRTWQTQHCGWLPPGPNVCNEKSGIGNGGPRGCTPTACTKGFHRYTLDWSRADQSATYYVDGVQVWRTWRGGNIPSDAWDAGFMGHGFIIILNIAMGGEMPCNTLGCLNGATTGGGHMDVDYVAAYTGPANAPPPPVGTGDNPSDPGPSGPPTCGPLISKGKPTTSSAIEAANLASQYAVDGNMATRWSSAFSDPQWMQIDLGSSQKLSRVKLDWETAYGSAYQIQVSNGANGPWTVAYDQPLGFGGTEDFAVNATGRYVRLYGTRRGTPYGYSLWEFSVYGACGSQPPPSGPPPSGSPSTGPSTPPPTQGQYPAWAPNVAYHVGDRVSYAGRNYQCQQAHTSIVTWEPPNTPALWIAL